MSARPFKILKAPPPLKTATALARERKLSTQEQLAIERFASSILVAAGKSATPKITIVRRAGKAVSQKSNARARLVVCWKYLLSTIDSTDYSHWTWTPARSAGASASSYTTFSTSQWMVALDAPGDRATLEFAVAMPAGWRAAGSGREVASRTAGARKVVTWRQERPAPSFAFGFIAGEFTEAVDESGNATLRYLGRGFSEAELRTIFRDTPTMVRFFEARAGVPYADAQYTQALVAVSSGQELAGLAHVSDAYGRAVLADASATSLVAHELAHQWWGTLVTNRDWTHFWLNEGFATFMAAAYKEQARGRAAYLADVDGWRRRLEQIRAAGREKPLVFADWSRPTADDRALVYQKGALVLHELRETLGDGSFWDAIRAYTREQAGRSVETADFQRAVERSTGRRLDAFFDRWIYLR